MESTFRFRPAKYMTAVVARSEIGIEAETMRVEAAQEEVEDGHGRGSWAGAAEPRCRSGSRGLVLPDEQVDP
jgi:hypothetical protein